MRAAEIEWSVLRGSIILLVIAVIISAGSLYGQFINSQIPKTRSINVKQAKYLSARTQYHTLDEGRRVNCYLFATLCGVRKCRDYWT